MKTIVNTKISLLALFLISMLSINSFADMELVKKVDIYAVNSMVFETRTDESDEVLWCILEVTFQSSYESDVRLTNTNFKIMVNHYTAETLYVEDYLGVGVNQEIYIKSNGSESTNDPSLTSQFLNIRVGSKNNPETIDRVLNIVNKIGQPRLQKRIIISGSCDLGAKIDDRGWATAETVSVDFEFKPKLQDEVLMQ